MLQKVMTRHGIILAAGKGSRFHQNEPLVGGKQLITIDGEPLIVHGVRLLLRAGATQVSIAASPETAPMFRTLFRDPIWRNVEVYTLPESRNAPETLYKMLTCLKESDAAASVLVLLGDNLFAPDSFPSDAVARAITCIDQGENTGLLILIEDPQAVERAVVMLDPNGRVCSVQEKPEKPTSNLAVTGFYTLPRTQAQAACKEIACTMSQAAGMGDLVQRLINSGTDFLSVQLPENGRVAVDRRSDATKAASFSMPPAARKLPLTTLPTIFITGIAGFIGSRLARMLVARGYPVRGVDDLSTGYAENLPDELELGRDWIKLDLTLPSATKRLTKFLRESCKSESGIHLVHTACPAYDAMSYILNRFVTAGVAVGTATTLSAAVNAGVSRFINLSSMARYESLSLDLHRKWTGYREDDATASGMSPYGNAKLAAEKNMRVMLDSFGIPWTNLVFHNVIGVGQAYNNPARNVASMLLNMALHGKPLFIHGEGKQRRVFTQWEDVEFAVYELVTDTRHTYDGLTLNIGPGAEHSTSILELCEMIAGVAARKTGRPYTLDIRSTGTHSLASLQMAFCNDQRYRGMFGASPAPDIGRTLAEMADVIMAREKEFDYCPFRHADLPLSKIPVYRDRAFHIG